MMPSFLRKLVYLLWKLLLTTTILLVPASAAQALPALQTRLTSNNTAIEAVSPPEGTTQMKVAWSTAETGGTTKYLWPNLKEPPWISPPAPVGYPWAAMQAVNSSGTAISEWSKRLLLGQHEETQAEKEAREKAEREAKELAEREAKEQAEREAREKAEREAREKAEREQREKEEASSTMVKGLDIGGWAWESALRDESGAVKYVRSSYTHFNSESQVGLAARFGLHILPLFFESKSMQELDNNSSVETIVTWCKHYCHGGSYWAGKTDLGATTIELVNEPGNPYLHSGEPRSESSKLAYADLTKKVHAALAVNFIVPPKLLVSYDGGFEGDQYGRWIFSHGAVADGVTVHPYGGHTSREQSALGGRTRVTEAHNSGLPVYVTEVGWPTCGETGDSLNWTEQEQATNIINWVHWTRELKYVPLTVNFNYADYSGNCYGIVKSAGSPHKLSYAALAGA